jgi:hypothetical protein
MDHLFPVMMQFVTFIFFCMESLAGSIETGAHNKAKVGKHGASVQTGRKHTHEKTINYCPIPPDVVPEMPEDRHCICDENIQCSECTVNERQCLEHDGLYCSSCNEWFHAKCIGGIIRVVDGAKFMEIALSDGKSLSIMLHGPSQDADPWYCFRCWEYVKLGKRASTVSKPFSEVSKAVQALRLGIDTSCKHYNNSTWKTRSDAYIAELPKAIGDVKIAQSILTNTPRAYPTPTPMDADARFHLKCAGRRFEISQLCINIRSCDCCGATRPSDSDPWGGKCALTGQSVAGKHLRQGLYQAHKYV